MHMVVMRRDVYKSDPSLAVDLLDAFHRAKEAARSQMLDTTALAVMHPWMADEMKQLEDLFSGDPFTYGFEANRAILEAMTTYSHEQGLSSRRLEPADLFAPETLDWTPSP
jgi:4,5-dihydroxyphthalate decarboxylase